MLHIPALWYFGTPVTYPPPPPPPPWFRCNTPTFCIAAVFVKYCYTTGSCYNSWANLRCSGYYPLGENYCETGLIDMFHNNFPTQCGAGYRYRAVHNWKDQLWSLRQTNMAALVRGLYSRMKISLGQNACWAKIVRFWWDMVYQF